MLMRNILYIGSGNSALAANNIEFGDHIKVAVNNAWRIFDNKKFDTWIHSGDFPRENYPTSKNYDNEIFHKHYSESAEKAAKLFEWKTTSPQHYAGYTIFFLGLYYILMEMDPDRIGLLGFDHDYNVEKVEKWNKDGRPNIQNHFNNKKEKTIKEWSSNYFGDMKKDFFYGHGTPDPLRLGEAHLLKKFEIAKESACKLGVDIYNYSGVLSKINTFPHMKYE